MTVSFEGSANSGSDQSDDRSTANLAVIVLAAGQGTRMRSALPKVLHGFAGRSMLEHVLAATAALDVARTAVVVGHGREQVTAHLADVAADAVAVVQEEQRGTGHAVRVALAALDSASAGHSDASQNNAGNNDTGNNDAAPSDVSRAGTVLVLPGDAPLLTSAALLELLAIHRATGAAATLLTSRVTNPTGYGRVLRTADGAVQAVVEDNDATDDQRLVDEVSALVYAFDADLLREAVRRLGTDNAQGEEYLPDVIGLLRADGHEVQAVLAPAAETAGVNDRVQLAAAYRSYNARIVEGHMRGGVTVYDPATTWIDADVLIEPDVVLWPGVHLQGRSRIGAAAVIGPDTSLRDTSVGARSTVERSVATAVTIGADCTIGPFAYLRGGAELAESVKVGTFVEVKNSTIGSGSKVPHLSYVGDATIGRRSNIGASTVFANYDGVTKNRSEVGDDVRISSDTTLVAPVSIGNGAYTGAGAVIREDVPADALAVSAGHQRNIENWASARRARIADSTHPSPAASQFPTVHQPTDTEEQG